MARMGWLLAGLLLAMDAAAQSQVYKCSGGPHPVYQQMPCAGQAEWRWEIPAEASAARGAAPAKQRATAPPARPVPRPRARAGMGTGVRGAVISLSRDAQRCERARSERVQQLGRARRLDYLQRRQLDDAVHAACR